MIQIVPVKTKKEQKEFICFPLELYKNNPYFVPPLYADEKKMFKKDFVYNDTCEFACFLAKDQGKTVGRIQAILSLPSNKKTGEKRVRFTRFDCIKNEEVARALFNAVENFAISRGMDTVCGPLGFSDLEREGLLIEGFNELSTFEEQYNFEYYGEFIENLGYNKEVDWTESKIFAPKEGEAEMQKMADFVMKRYNLHIGKAKNVSDFLNKYADAFFNLLDISYENLYGTVPFTDGMKKIMIDNFKLIIDLKHVVVILNEKEELVCLGICFPSLAKAVQKSGGRLTPAAIIRVLKAIKNPEIIDLGLIAVHPDYLNRGVTAIISAELIKMLKNGNVKYAETNLNLENNFAILNQWKRFDSVTHKRRRAYVKRLNG